MRLSKTKFLHLFEEMTKSVGFSSPQKIDSFFWIYCEDEFALELRDMHFSMIHMRGNSTGTQMRLSVKSIRETEEQIRRFIRTQRDFQSRRLLTEKTKRR